MIEIVALLNLTIELRVVTPVLRPGKVPVTRTNHAPMNNQCHHVRKANSFYKAARPSRLVRAYRNDKSANCDNLTNPRTRNHEYKVALVMKAGCMHSTSYR